MFTQCEYLMTGPSTLSACYRYTTQIGLACLFGALVAHDLSWQQMLLRPGDDTARAVCLLIDVSGCIFVLDAMLNDLLTLIGR
jgi:hypothetical protein